MSLGSQMTGHSKTKECSKDRLGCFCCSLKPNCNSGSIGRQPSASMGSVFADVTNQGWNFGCGAMRVKSHLYCPILNKGLEHLWDLGIHGGSLEPILRYLGLTILSTSASVPPKELSSGSRQELTKQYMRCS